MPVTRGQSNPDWTREETILALDLLYRYGKPLDRKHSAIEDLSEFLRRAELHPKESRGDNFRNVDGVALKLQNLFSAVEPGRGLTFSRTDRMVVDDYPRSRASELSATANALRKSLIIIPDDGATPVDEEEVFAEGRWLTVRHRQRDARLRHRLLARTSVLRCEICDFQPLAVEMPIRECFFEAHHRVPLAAAERERTTKVSDMALLCARCHRLIHRLSALHRRWVTVDDARTYWLTVSAQRDCCGV